MTHESDLQLAEMTEKAALLDAEVADVSLQSPPSYEKPTLQKHERDYDHQGDGTDEVERRPTKVNGLTFYLMLSVSAAVIGSSTQFGYNTGVINNPKEAIQSSFNGSNGTGSIFSDNEMNVAIAIFAIGGMLGALSAGIIADILGRKYSMLLNNVVVVIGVCLESLAVHPFMFIAGRFVIGVNAGINTVLVPLYISEIAPINLRGSVGVCHQMAITSTILLSQILGIHSVLGRPDSEFYGWRILLGVPLLFAVFQLAVLPWCPQSPKFLYIKRKKEGAAMKALAQLRGSGTNIDKELQDLKDELEELQKPKEKLNLLQFITRGSLRQALLVSIVLHLSQQLSGIGGVLYYSNDIFKAAGVQHEDIATVVTGLALVIFTIITVFLIEVAGRRTLMLYGLGGMAIFFTFLTSMFCFQDGFYGNDANPPGVTAPGVLLVISSIGIIALFALGPGGIPWLMVAELFLQEARPIAVTIATIINWFTNFVVGLAFPYILRGLAPYGTGLFIFICAILWFYLYLFLPETKGRSVEDITQEFRRRAKETPAAED